MIAILVTREAQSMGFHGFTENPKRFWPHTVQFQKLLFTYFGEIFKRFDPGSSQCPPRRAAHTLR